MDYYVKIYSIEEQSVIRFYCATLKEAHHKAHEITTLCDNYLMEGIFKVIKK